jgi:hypothetical protein
LIRLAVGNLERVDRHHRLHDDVGIGVLRERLPVVAERAIAFLVETLAGANRLQPDLRIAVLHQRAHERRIGRIQTVERP